MDKRLDTLESILARTATIMATAEAGSPTRATPCEEYDVSGLLDHLAVWVQVFAGAINDSPPRLRPDGAPRD